jgi:PEP-CTERM motif
MAIAAGGGGAASFFGGAGGAATANDDSNSGGTGNATSTAEATGGRGGDGSPSGVGGAATSSSNATSNAGDATSTAEATGGAGGDGAGGAGGAATSSSNATSGLSGNTTSNAEASGGAGGSFISGTGGTISGTGGPATASSNATSNVAGTASSSANATGGAGGVGNSNFSGKGGDGGDATAMAIATAAGGGTAMANSVATGGVGGAGEVGSIPGAAGAANATSNAETVKGGLAQARSTAVGSSGQAQSTALTSFSFVKVQSAAVAQVGSTATTNAIAQGGGSGQAFVNPGQTAYAFSTALPDKAYSATLIGGASHVASALLGPRDAVFGTAILGANYAPDGGGESETYSATSTFDFGYGGDLRLGLIDDQVSGFANGLGFQSMEFTIAEDGVEVLDVTFGSLAIAESFFRDDVIDLGADLGPIDLTFGYKLIADGSGGLGFDLAIGGAVPEPSTWSMMLIGFAGLGYAGYRRAREPRAA